MVQVLLFKAFSMRATRARFLRQTWTELDSLVNESRGERGNNERPRNVSARVLRSNSNAAFRLLHLVSIESRGCRAIDNRSGCDVETGAVALTHDGRRQKQSPGERAGLAGAGAEIIESVETIFDTRN
jgi:hypothetical protein